MIMVGMILEYRHRGVLKESLLFPSIDVIVYSREISIFSIPITPYNLSVIVKYNLYCMFFEIKKKQCPPHKYKQR